jgi:DNA primase
MDKGNVSYFALQFQVITQQTIQQILSHIDIIDVVGEFVRLKKRGTNYLGLCPFHNEKTPSFTVSPSKEIYKCFGCGRSGNTISFLMEHEKYSYAEALRWLAARYNIPVEETETSAEFRQLQQVSDSLYILNSFAQKYFSSQLRDTEEGRDIALSYLHERGFTDAIIDKFQLGYNPQARDLFAKAATAAQYNPELLRKSGLVVERDGLADNYRGRIIFPIHNQSGKILGFGARVIGKADRAPKYINTPENEIYIKSKILYGSYFARHAIDKANECLLVEGYTDVISLHQAGIENVVASGGTSLTVDQLRLIKKYTPNLTIIYDGDPAGIKAAMRGLDLALEEGLQVQLVLIPDNEDPDSYVHKVGAAAFQHFIQENKKDVILFQVEVSMREAGNDSQKKAALVNQIADSISRLNKAEDFTRQQDYIHRCSEIMKVDEQGLTTLVNKYIRERINKEEKKQQREDAAASGPVEETETRTPDETIDLIFRDEQQERAAVRALVEFGTRPWDDEKTVADHIFDEIEENGLHELIDNKQLLTLIDAYRQAYHDGATPQPRDFLYHEDPDISRLAVSLFDTTYEISPRWKDFYDGPLPGREELYRQEVYSCYTYLKLRKIKRMILENQQDIEKGTDDLHTLLQTHQHLKALEIELTRLIGTVILK